VGGCAAEVHSPKLLSRNSIQEKRLSVIGRVSVFDLQRLGKKEQKSPGAFGQVAGRKQLEVCGPNHAQKFDRIRGGYTLFSWLVIAISCNYLGQHFNVPSTALSFTRQYETLRGESGDDQVKPSICVTFTLYFQDSGHINGATNQRSKIRMYITPRNLFPVFALVAATGIMFAGRLSAQTFANLHTFSGFTGNYVNTDGLYSVSSLILSGTNLYGTAVNGGTGGSGTIFAVNTSGTVFAGLHSFAPLGSGNTNSDGADPFGALVLSGTNLYGTASVGGTGGAGVIFSIHTDGSGFTNLYNFTSTSGSLPHTNLDGSSPQGGLILSGTNFYGTASGGGLWGSGTVFRLNTDGTGFTNLHSFLPIPAAFPFTNADGASPICTLVLSGTNLYGTTEVGGIAGAGTVFKVSTDGSVFTNLHIFTPVLLSPNDYSDGNEPYAGLVLSGTNLYGTAHAGGSGNSGTVFKVSTDGTGFTNLYNFTAVNGGGQNSDGNRIDAGLVLSGNTLYGTASYGGLGLGTIYAVNTDGSGFKTLYEFNFSNGWDPEAGLLLSGNTLFGTARYGGSANDGAVFSVALPSPRLTIGRSGANVILTWPTYDSPGMTLQSATNPGAAAWNAVSPGPLLVNGQNTVTNPIAGAQQFYQLSH
jgi:uncharacterized repeat protein (TIGR03803 family)